MVVIVSLPREWSVQHTDASAGAHEGSTPRFRDGGSLGAGGRGVGAGMVTTVGGQVPAPPLLERERELAAVTATVDAAAAGRGAVLWVEGPAGIGKTRLLQAARDHALLHGVRVLRARGNELEREFAFGVVRGLYEPAVAAQPAVLLVGPARLAARSSRSPARRGRPPSPANACTGCTG